MSVDTLEHVLGTDNNRHVARSVSFLRCPQTDSVHT